MRRATPQATNHSVDAILYVISVALLLVAIGVMYGAWLNWQT